MGRWNNGVLTGVVERLSPVSAGERAAILAGPPATEDHLGHFDRLPALREIEAGGTARVAELDQPARIAFWNVERLRHLYAIAGTLQAIGADLNLLCEVDRGMARSGNGHPVAELADRLGQAYVYAVEFIELGLGDADEAAAHAEQANAEGFHGAALVSAVALAKPFLLRLDARGAWFDGRFGQRRVGGRIAIGARIRVGGRMVTAVSVHLESSGDPEMRGRDMDRMLGLIDEVAAGEPVILGGDFNTSTAGPADRADAAAWNDRLAREPERLLAPAPFEPLFEAAQRHGYGWQAANVHGQPTQRFAEGDTKPRGKLDWFFTRGLVASDPRIIPALRPDGSPSSDHDALVVTVAPLR
jgi:endonuclease/exonuclease/phosphatase family metal-dependent hydrolase